MAVRSLPVPYPATSPTEFPATDRIPAAYPLIHLGFAYELSSPTLAIEALASAAILYSEQHKYLEDPIYTAISDNSTSSLLDVLWRVQQDTRFDSLCDISSVTDRLRELFQHHESTVLEYWNSWSITDVSGQFRDSQRLAVLLVSGSTTTTSSSSFTTSLKEATTEITFLPALKASRALRILLPLVPARFHIPLLRQWWLFVLGTYIIVRRPPVDPARISGQTLDDGRLDERRREREERQLGDGGWNEVKKMARSLYAVEDADRLQGMCKDSPPLPLLYRSRRLIMPLLFVSPLPFIWISFFFPVIMLLLLVLGVTTSVFPPIKNLRYVSM